MNHYWRGLAERGADEKSTAQGEAEFGESPLQIEAGPDRRGFLKAAGFTFGGALLAGCSRPPAQKAVPYLQEPEGVNPGRSYSYATTCTGCAAGCGVLAKVRDGRPIKLEGNPEHPLSRGGLCAVGQAGILGLYDSLRLRQPVRLGKPASWAEVDGAVTAELDRIRTSGGAVRFLTETVTSPTSAWMISLFLKTFRDARHVIYDPLSCSAILDAHELTHGARVLPRYHFDQAEAIVSFDADFLATWISPVEFTRAYVAGRNAEMPARYSYHVQYESRMSVTGSKADRRVRMAPGEIENTLARLAARVETEDRQDEVSRRLLEARGRSLVVCGLQSVRAQALCNQINHLLGNYGVTLEVERPSFQRQGNDRELARLLGEIDSGRVAALFIDGVNPVYDLPRFDLSKVPLIVSFADRMNETAAAARFVCPGRHALESWGDSEPVSGTVSLLQPVIQPLGDTRQVVESLAAWMGASRSAYDILRESWQANIFPRQKQQREFRGFWETAIQAGFVEAGRAAGPLKPFHGAVRSAGPPKPASGFALVLYAKPGMLDGRHAYNPWLQELPDPITKATWDNYACLAPAAAARLGVDEGGMVRLELEGQSIELPVIVQPGQHEETVAVALGYGAKASARFAQVGPKWIDARATLGENGLVGRNAAPFLAIEDGSLQYTRHGLRVTPIRKKAPLAVTQSHHTLSAPKPMLGAAPEPRPAIQEATLAALATTSELQEHLKEDLWPEDHPYTGHSWGMTVDLNACTGCSACVVACQAENNTPVVGKDEVRRRREMHWMRIDRYYSGSPENADVAHQPMFCQQCGHAPCETVCPVLATVHSSEGLNQQIYNRCVGTRYCANNCPYKTRRFNWFNYLREDALANMVLNPDVAVRSRGVMEKCTFCVQRIQEARIEARRTGEPLADGAIQTACQQSCPAQAIEFGDLNDPKSRVSQRMRSRRRYRVLEEINTRPAVGYLKIVRNRPTEGGEKQNG